MREIDKFIESNDDLKHAVKAYDQLKAAEITWQNPEFDLLDEETHTEKYCQNSTR